MRTLAVAFLLLLTPGFGAAQTTSEAPFGLTRGMTAEAVRDLGVVLAGAPDETTGKSFIATKVPKVVADAELIQLSFGYDNRLWRIAAAGKSNQNDPYGSAVKRRYDELSTALAEKYGKGNQHHHAAQFYDTELFTMGIKTGTNWWYTDFENSTISVQLGISATDLNTPHWLLIFQNKALKGGIRTRQERA